MRHLHFRQQGVTLVEVMIAIGIIAVIVVVIGFSVTSFVDARSRLLNNVKAQYLAEEGYEILRSLRDDNWNTIDSLAVDTTQYLSVSTSTVALSGTPEVIDGEFYRSFVLSPVYRNSNDDITASTTSGAVIDSGAVEVRVSVFGPTGTTSLRGILTNLHAI